MKNNYLCTQFCWVFTLVYLSCLRLKDFVVVNVVVVVCVLIHSSGLVLLTSQISSSECRPRGSTLLLTLPLKSVGSWGMMLSFILRSLSPMLQMSRSSVWVDKAEQCTQKSRLPTPSSANNSNLVSS
jgi:uncharacterized protein YhhL (DUF1145 family)